MAPETMLAAVYAGGGTLDVRELPVPELGPHDALVQISHCGICGTDLHLVLEEYARPGSVLGHEWAGTIAAVGDAVDGWEPGTRVVTDPQPGCGTCRACRNGRPSVCLRRPPPDYLDFSGAFCSYVRVPAARLLRIPEELPLRAAALTEPTAIALHAAHLAGATPDDRVLVTGAGPVGLLIVAVLASLDVHDITVSEPAPERRQRALQVGADACPRARPSSRRCRSDGRSRTPTRSPSSARAGPTPGSPPSTTSTTRGRWCSSGPAARRCRSTTTG